MARCVVRWRADARAALAWRADGLVYAAAADTRLAGAIEDLVACLEAGANVVATGVYLLLHPPSTPPELRAGIEAACGAGGGPSVFVSGIDPGWAVDLLPLVLSGFAGRIDQIRCREIFDYAPYDQPHAVRNLIGFGRPLDEQPPMLHPMALELLWGGMARVLADGLGIILDETKQVVERRPLERTIDTPEMGVFEKGTQGAFRFEVSGIARGEPVIVCELITRIDDEIAPDWPRPPEGQRGCYAVILEGEPRFEAVVQLHGG